MTDYTKSLAFFSLVFLFIHYRPKAKSKTIDAVVSAVIVLIFSPDLTNSAVYALVFLIVTLIIMLLEEGRDS